MDDVQENSVMPEVATPETNHAVQAEAPPVETKQDKNWREMRMKQQQLENELRMQKEMNERLMQMTLANQPTPKQEVDELDSLSDDEFLPKGKVKKLMQKERDSIKKEALQEFENIQKQREQSRFLDNLKSRFSDFDEVVNADTMALLEEKDPELAQTIVELKDPYKIGVQTYKYIKAMKLSEKVPDARRAKEVDKKLEQNAKTVQTPQAYDKRPMAQAFKMTDSDYKDLYKEMMGYASQASYSY